MPYQSYIICTSPRSGSTLLCKLLAATGKAGNPDSHFHVPSMSAWLKAYALSASDYACERDIVRAIIEAGIKKGTGKAGLFGLRMQQDSFGFFMQQVGILCPTAQTDVERIEAAFGATLFIHLTRPNKLDQAISQVIATQTGLWHRAADGTELERLSAQKEPVYDADQIAHDIEKLSANDEEWRNWFSTNDLAPLCVDYDDLSADPNGVLAKVMDKLGLDPGLARGIQPPVAKLANATNRNWSERFLTESRGG